MRITIPTNLNEIKLSQYQKFVKILNENEESEFLSLKMIEIFCGVDLKFVMQMRQKDVEEITNKLGVLFKKEYSLIKSFELGGKEFGFIPNLDDISSGEYMDLDNYINNWELMHKAMAVLYRPIIKKLGERYQIEEYKGSDMYCETLKNMPLNVVFSAVVFFYLLGKDLLKNTTDYLEKAKMENIHKYHNLENVGAGIQVSMHLLKEMLEDSMKLPKFPLINA